MQDGLIGREQGGGRANRLAGTEVAQSARMRAAGDDQPQAMALLEAVRRGP